MLPDVTFWSGARASKPMQEYDIALKLLLKGSARIALREVAGATVAKWLDIELPKLQNPRVDLFGETAEGCLIHVELQSTNDSSMLRGCAGLGRATLGNLLGS